MQIVFYNILKKAFNWPSKERLDLVCQTLERLKIIRGTSIATALVNADSSMGYSGPPEAQVLVGALEF